MPECFASVLSLAHRRFRTEVPGPLLTVPEPKGGGKGKGETAEERVRCIGEVASPPSCRR